MTTTAPAEQTRARTDDRAGRACVVCGGTSASTLYEGILRCDACGHVFADTRLSDEEYTLSLHDALPI